MLFQMLLLLLFLITCSSWILLNDIKTIPKSLPFFHQFEIFAYGGEHTLTFQFVNVKIIGLLVTFGCQVTF